MGWRRLRAWVAAQLCCRKPGLTSSIWADLCGVYCRQDLKRSFADKPWVDIFSKADLLQEHFAAADGSQTTVSRSSAALHSHMEADMVHQHGNAAGDSGCLEQTTQAATISSSSDTTADAAGTGPDEVSLAQGTSHSDAECDEACQSTEAQLQSKASASDAAVQASVQTAPAEANMSQTSSCSALHVIQALPSALRVSSTTKQGIADLKAAVTTLVSIS